MGNTKYSGNTMKKKIELIGGFILLALNAVSSFGSNYPEKVHPKVSFVAGRANNVFGSAKWMSTSAADATEEKITAENLNLLSERGRKVVEKMIESDEEGYQKHIYENWPAPGIEDEGKKDLAEQVRRFFPIAWKLRKRSKALILYSKLSIHDHYSRLIHYYLYC